MVLFKYIYFLLKWKFLSSEAKIHQKYFKIKTTPIWPFKATPIWPFKLFTDSPWKVARRQSRFLASPGEEGKGVILLIWNFDKHVFSINDANCWHHFSILQISSENASSLWNTHLWRDHGTTLHHFQRASFNLIPCLEAEIPWGNNSLL